MLALTEFLAALESVAAGGAAVDPTVVRSLVGDSLRASRLDSLSARERQVLALAAEGHTNVCIAAELGCAERTAESHMRAVFHKLDLIDDGLTHRRARGARLSHGPGSGSGLAATRAQRPSRLRADPHR